ncbi:MAG: FG-GAP-like repeat-containing protein, partial [Acidobacteriota bacterium]
MKRILSPSIPVRPRFIFLALFGLSLIHGSVFAGEIPFSTQNVIDLTFLDARSVETIDIDGDGDLDVMAVAQGSQDDVGWFENTAGDGSAWTERLITDGLTNPGWARAGDIDGDGDLDVVAADLGDLSNTGQVVWLENTGAYGAAWPQVVIASFNGVEPVEVGDLDGDGDLDVVASSFLIDDVVWYENTGAGATWAAARKIDDFLQGKGLAVFDVDQDGDLDVGTAAPDGFARVDFGKVTWSENPGPAAIGAAASWTRHELNDALFDGARGLCFADIDGDGDIDAGTAADGDGGQPDAIAWFENSGD